jgi:Holliday junction resolvase-like predicted endonuclease
MLGRKSRGKISQEKGIYHSRAEFPVRVRRNRYYRQSVTALKIKRLKRAAACYASTRPVKHSGVRIDVVEILTRRGTVHIHHIENIFG